MTVTPASLRAQFPAFRDASRYPDAQVSFYVGLGYKLTSPDAWGELQDEGVTLFVAHYLAVDALAARSGVGGVPGTGVGVVNSGSVDKVSYGRDVSSVAEAGGGHWNMTTYGLQYLRLARMVGAGPVQVGASDPGDQSASLYAGAWAGPFVSPYSN